jgi:hypothetical protein
VPSRSLTEQIRLMPGLNKIVERASDNPWCLLLGVTDLAGFMKLVWFDIFKFAILKLEIFAAAIATVSIYLARPLCSIIFIGQFLFRIIPRVSETGTPSSPWCVLVWNGPLIG